MATETDTPERKSAKETIQDRRQERIDALQAAFADFHRARSIVMDPKSNDEAVVSDDAIEAACDLEADAIRRITGLRSKLDYQVWSKFDLLEYMMNDGDCHDYDPVIAGLIWSIKADLKGLGIGKRGKA